MENLNKDRKSRGGCVFITGILISILVGSMVGLPWGLISFLCMIMVVILYNNPDKKLLRVSDTFMELCLKGQATYKDIDEYVEMWHTSESTEDLFRYLGMTWSEYSVWKSFPDSLHDLILIRLGK